MLACKVCNKEQSMKFQHTWKRHFLTHSSDEDKPHKCEVCGKAMVTASELKSHLKSHAKKATKSTKKSDGVPSMEDYGNTNFTGLYNL